MTEDPNVLERGYNIFYLKDCFNLPHHIPVIITFKTFFVDVGLFISVEFVCFHHFPGPDMCG